MSNNPAGAKLAVTKLEDRVNLSGFAGAADSGPGDNGYVDPWEVERHNTVVESSDVQSASSAEDQSTATSGDDGYVEPWEVEKHSNGPSQDAVRSEQNRAVNALDINDLASASSNQPGLD